MIFKSQHNKDGGKWKCEIQKFKEEPQNENPDRKVASLHLNVFATNQYTSPSTFTEKISIATQNQRGN